MSGDLIDLQEAQLPGRLVDGALLRFRDTDDPEVFLDLARILAHRLSPLERFCLAWAAIQALEDSDRDLLADEVSTRAGRPMPQFLAAVDDAANWVAAATEKERKLYLWACWRALPQAERDAFLRKIAAEVAA